MSDAMRASVSGTIAVLTTVATLLPGLGTSKAMADVDVVSAPAPSGFLQPRQIVGASRISTTLSAAPSSSHSYRITCFDDGSGAPVRFMLKVQNRTKSSTYRVQATISRNGEEQSVIDTANGDNRFSAYAVVNQGAGDYILTLSKVKAKVKDADSKLKGAAVIQTMQECDTQTGKYTGLYPATPLD
ncbi:MAG: hypothetical protein RLZZ627_791 [Pseudomonadota bacterium]|jgi:hypothetical protein